MFSVEAGQRGDILVTVIAVCACNVTGTSMETENQRRLDFQERFNELTVMRFKPLSCCHIPQMLEVELSGK